MRNYFLFILGAILFGMGVSPYFNDILIAGGMFSIIVGFAFILNREEI